MLQIGNKLITAPIERILQQVKKETGNKFFKDIRVKGKNVAVTCPNHKEGNERNPSCYIYTADDNETEYGLAHCFTCDYTASLSKVISDCFSEAEDFGSEWLIERFGDVFVETIEYLPEIELGNKKKIYPSIDEDILNEYRFYHPYMWERGLTKDVVDKFSIGYDAKRNAITFPLWDDRNNLIGVTARSVVNRTFWIPQNIEKPVYLLNFCTKENYSCIYVCEAQLDALKLWGFGLPAVALIGTGTPYQYSILKRCGIRSFVTCFDGDEAGSKGRKRFNKELSDCLITNIYLPEGKDVNDLSYDEFISLNYS